MDLNGVNVNFIKIIFLCLGVLHLAPIRATTPAEFEKFVSDGNLIKVSEAVSEKPEIIKTEITINYTECPDFKTSFLHLAAEKGHLNVAEFLLKNGAVIDSQDSDGQQPIHMAAVSGNLDLVQALINNFGAKFNAQADNQSQPSH